MSQQREKPGTTPEQLAKTLGRDSAEGVIVSGGQIENFREGWAVDIWSSGNRAHFFKRSFFNIGNAYSKCGIFVEVRGLYGEGNHDRCKRCLNAQK